jgi:hypothetical protein
MQRSVRSFTCCQLPCERTAPPATAIGNRYHRHQSPSETATKPIARSPAVQKSVPDHGALSDPY